MKTLYTSYFGRIKQIKTSNPEVTNDRLFSIARFTPRWAGSMVGISILAPSYELLSTFKQDLLSMDDYGVAYTVHLANHEQMIIDFLLHIPEGSILCCYERPNDFCHRHILSEWLMKHHPDKFTISEL